MHTRSYTLYTHTKVVQKGPLPTLVPSAVADRTEERERGGKMKKKVKDSVHVGTEGGAGGEGVHL